MINQTKWNNKELLYGITFLVAGVLWFFLNPVGEVADFIDSLPNALDIKYKLLDFGILPIFYHTYYISVIGLFFFTACSIFAGIISLRKASVDGVRKLYGSLPISIPGFLAVLLIFISSFV